LSVAAIERLPRFVPFLAAGLLVGMQKRSAPGDAVYAKPGRIVAATDGARLNFYCTGSGSPTVIFDSGWEDWSPDWAVVQPRVAKFTQACSYDRAGVGYSGAGPMPRTSVRIAEELHSAMHAAGIAGPYILVGNAFGGVPARTFAQLYTLETAGLVMAEADASDVETQAMQNADHAGQSKFLDRVRECRDSIAAGKPLPPLPARPGQPNRTCAQQFFRGLPEDEWSAELNAALLHLAETNVALYDASISEMEETLWDETWLKQNRHSLGARPVRVLTTGNHGVSRLPNPKAQDSAFLADQHQIAQAQARWLELSSNAKQVFVENSSEYIGFDQPDVVVNAIREVYDQSK
jgi:pimeloyl-ACP methyl ester carboxylesterase